MRVLLIGGSGFICKRVVRSLHKRGHEVILFNREPDKELDLSNIKHIKGNRLDIDDKIEKIRKARPDAAVDFLPWNDKDTSLVTKTLNGLVERVVHLSSGDVYRAWGNFLTNAFGEPIPIAEDSPLRKTFYPYAGTTPGLDNYDKILAERAIFNANYEDGYPGVILRLPLVYGPGESHYRAWRFVKAMLDNRESILLSPHHGSWLWQRGYVDNIAFGITLAVEREIGIGQVYNIGCPQTLSFASWVRAIGDILGWEGQIILAHQSQLPSHLHSPYSYSQHIVFNTAKIRQDLGYYEVVKPKKALKRTIKWMVKNPPPDSMQFPINYAAEDEALATILTPSPAQAQTA